MNFELIQDFMVLLVTCKNKEDPIENHIDFSEHGQLTLWSMVASGRSSNSSKLLCISSLPARMKKIWAYYKYKNKFAKFDIVLKWVKVNSGYSFKLCRA